MTRQDENYRQPGEEQGSPRYVPLPAPHLRPSLLPPSPTPRRLSQYAGKLPAIRGEHQHGPSLRTRRQQQQQQRRSRQRQRRLARRLLPPLGAVLALALLLLLILSPFSSALFLRHPSQRLRLIGETTMTVPAVVPLFTRTPSVNRPTFERGIATPVWSPSGLDAGSQWSHDLTEIASPQVGATWIEQPVLLSFGPDPTAPGQERLLRAVPSLSSLAAGIHTAHKAGLSVFLTPLVMLSDVPSGWVGMLAPASPFLVQRWFAAYSAAWLPYVRLAASLRVEQVAVATEWVHLSYAAPVALWESLLGEMASAYTGKLTYDMNWTEAMPAGAFPTWMEDPRLSALGISEYMPLLSTSGSIPPSQVAALWKARIRPLLDGVALHTGKPVLLSELGYRDTGDLFYQTWRPDNPTASPPDEAQQQAAYGAALSLSLGDSRVIGAFVWGWRNAGLFSLVGDTGVIAVIASVYQGR